MKSAATPYDDPQESITRGTSVVVRDSQGREHQKIALSGVTAGRDIAVVWACRPSEWVAALAEDRDPDGVPWPAADVRAAE
jgi:hypothetical protein